MEVTAAWMVAQQLALAYATTDPPLAAWRHEYLAYFDTDRACNGPTETINLLIEKVRRVGHGYRNWHNYRLRLLLHCGTAWDTLLPKRVRRLNHTS